MRKFIKVLCAIISLAVLLSCVTVGAFAAVSDGTVIFKVHNDIFHAEIPEGFTLLYSEDIYSFVCEKNNDTYYISFYCFENPNCIDLNVLPATDIEALCAQMTGSLEENNYCQYFFQKAETGVKVNGCDGIKATFKYDDFDDEYYEDEFYMIAGKTKFAAVSFRSFGGFEDGDIKSVLNSFVLNDELFEGQSFERTVDFSDAPSYEEALGADVADTDEWLYGVDSDMQLSDEEMTSLIMAALLMTTAVTCVPTLALIVVAIIFIVKYSKKKKKLRDYERKFGVR